MDTTLVIMAAGIGSRFGKGIKQLTGFGPHGEIIMDYSIYDAIKAGFNKIVFVIRKDLYEDFYQIIGKRIAEQVSVDYAFQEKDNLPAGYGPFPERKKPWGTGQAILACKKIVREPFAVLNADDFYGRMAFERIHSFLTEEHPASERHQIGMAGFILRNTLSEFGGVTRGICQYEGDKVTSVLETRNIVPDGDDAKVLDAEGRVVQSLPGDSLSSMNFWGLFPDFFDVLEKGFADFLSELSAQDYQKQEYLLPIIIDDLLRKKQADLSVLPSHDRWFGVTYQEDVPTVKEEIRKLILAGKYPEYLWKA